MSQQPVSTKVPAGISRPRPVLMIPLRRCGSHALRLRLNFNPDFYSPYPLHIIDFMPMVELYGDLRNDHAYFQMIVDIIGLQTASMVKWPDIVFEPETVFDAIQHEPRSVHRIVWELLFQAGMKRGARVVMDKSLDTVAYAAELVSLFDDMLFLNVVRDPRAQVNSMNKAIIHDFDTLLNAKTWVKAYETGRRLAETFPERVLTIRYEDFVANEEAVLRKICSFFNIEFRPSMLEISRSQEARKISVMSALWESNANAPIPANIDKFKKTLSPLEIALIETLAKEYMDYYGYERITSGSFSITDAMVAAAKKLSDDRREKAWAQLKEVNYRDYELRKFRAEYLRMVRTRLQAAGWSVKGAARSCALHDVAIKNIPILPAGQNGLPLAGPRHAAPVNPKITREAYEQDPASNQNENPTQR